MYASNEAAASKLADKCRAQALPGLSFAISSSSMQLCQSSLCGRLTDSPVVTLSSGIQITPKFRDVMMVFGQRSGLM